LLRKHCFLPMFRHVSQSGQTLGNISEKHRETSNVSEFARKHFCFPGSKFCFRNNVSTGGQTWKHLRKHRESQMFPQQCFLVCPGLKAFFLFFQLVVDLCSFLDRKILVLVTSYRGSLLFNVTSILEVKLGD
jgi:hypothetical protein